MLVTEGELLFVSQDVFLKLYVFDLESFDEQKNGIIEFPCDDCPWGAISVIGSNLRIMTTRREVMLTSSGANLHTQVRNPALAV